MLEINKLKENDKTFEKPIYSNTKIKLIKTDIERKEPSSKMIIKYIKIMIFLSLFIFIFNFTSEECTEEEKVKKEEIYANISLDKNLETDNKINLYFYENNIDYSNFTTDIKVLAIYLPNFYPINKGSIISNINYDSLKFLKNITPIYRGHHQPRKPDKTYINNYNLEKNLVIKKQIELAQSHGIYGFAIYYYWFSGKTIFNRPLNIIYNNKKNFHYMLIWRNEKVINESNEIILEEKYEENDLAKFIKDIKKYLIDKLYIRKDGKPMLGIYRPKVIPKLNENILKMRQKARELGIGEIFIISRLNPQNKDEKNIIKIFDGVYKSPPKYLNETNIIRNIKDNYFFYYGLFYSNILSKNKIENLTVFDGSMLEYDNSPVQENGTIYGEYSPELFYILNKLLINKTKSSNDNLNRFLFINAWNNYYEGTYLEPDEKYGYSSINALSKAIFDLPYRNKIYNISNLVNECVIAVQAHIFYEDLLEEIISLTNNIPVKFDLYIATDNNKKMDYIKSYTNKNSKANSIIINIYENKGRDILPFLNQFKEVIDKYKYICHVHTKKSFPLEKIGKRWRTHLYINLLGTTEVISEILTDFENYDKLGIIFPDTYHRVLKEAIELNPEEKYYMNSLIDKIFPGYNISDKYFDFPAGDMFWARSKAIYQIFKLELKNEIPDEKGSKRILYAIERLWLFIAKLNGYYYKKYFKYYT